MMRSGLYEAVMSTAAAEARKWLGATAPNPPVGAVALNAAGEVIALAAHHRAGEQHAEALLIEQCRANNTLSHIDTVCVTLEPCNHFGRTPPCTDEIIRAGIKRVVIGTRDGNPHVQGGGIEKLQAAGIEVIVGIAENECRQLVHAFAYHAACRKPWITMKRALDPAGSMIPPEGYKTFTSPASLRLAHRLRKKADALVTGSGTILADNPLFNVRHVQDHQGKRRWLAILDRRGRIPEPYITAARERGLDVLIYTDVDDALHDLTARGAQDILIEAGPMLSQTLFDRGSWTMSVTLQQASPDTIHVAFNPREILPFDAKQFRWDYFLPQEQTP